MTTTTRTEYVTRDEILKLLSDSEVAHVSTAETAQGLNDGDEYLDLEKLNQGVLRAGGAKTPMGRVLPKKAVQASTWVKILGQLGQAPRA